MNFLINDLSLHGQFFNISSFQQAMQRVMHIREIIKRSGYNLYCSGNFINAQATSTLCMRKAISRVFNRDQKRAILGWMQQQGPFWEELRKHSSDDYFECRGHISTDTAVGEAAYRCLHGVEHHLISFTPSGWEYSPLDVRWHRDDDIIDSVDVCNYWKKRELEHSIEDASANIQSWKHLEEMSVSRYQHLIFSSTSFHPLIGHPFNRGAADHIRVLLHTLNRLICCVDQNGKRTPDGHEIYQKYFTGDKAWFSDSSTTEKNNFRNKLTFPNPVVKGQTLFCSWHGKIKTPPYRIHFARTETPGGQLCVVYVGPKLTKR